MRRLPVLVLALVLVAACGGDDDPAADPTAPSSTAPSTTATTEAEAPAVEASAGCGREPDTEPIGEDAPGDVALTFPSGGVERVYRLAVPTDYDPDVAVPLVLNLHGAGSDALQASVYGGVPRAATARGMVVAAPEALEGRWEISPGGADDDFLVALTDDLMDRYCIDERHVHVVGMSLGAWKAAVTTCGHPERYASAALVTVEVFPGTCEPTAVVAFHGTADQTVAYGEGGSEAIPGGPNEGITGARDNIAAWAENGGCDPEPELVPVGDDVEERRFRGCAPGVDVSLYSIDGGGHTWPGSDIIIGPPQMTTDTIDATEILLDFFEAHPRRP